MVCIVRVVQKCTSRLSQPLTYIATSSPPQKIVDMVAIEVADLGNGPSPERGVGEWRVTTPIDASIRLRKVERVGAPIVEYDHVVAGVTIEVTYPRYRYSHSREDVARAEACRVRAEPLRHIARVVLPKDVGMVVAVEIARASNMPLQ